MTVPNFLATPFNYLKTLGETDVANSITRISAQLLALGWTNPVGTTFQSPADSGGNFIKLTFNRISATQLEMVLLDSLSRTFTRRATTPASFTENLYCSSFAFYWDPGNTQGLWASIYDLSPELQSAHDQFCVGHGFQTAANADDSTFFTSGGMQLDASSPRVFSPVKQISFLTRANFDGGNLGAGYSQPGSRLWYPIIHVGLSMAGVTRIRGRVQQAIWVHLNEAVGSEFSVPLDQATTGLFKVLSFRSDSSTFAYAMAARKA